MRADERRNDERDRLRAACDSELDELRTADEDEVSEVVEEVRKIARASRPDSDKPPKHVRGLVAVLEALPPWSRPVVLLAAVAALAALGATGHLARWW